jgi:hypothetical protein
LTLPLIDTATQRPPPAEPETTPAPKPPANPRRLTAEDAVSQLIGEIDNLRAGKIEYFGNVVLPAGSTSLGSATLGSKHPLGHAETALLLGDRPGRLVVLMTEGVGEIPPGQSTPLDDRVVAGIEIDFGPNETLTGMYDCSFDDGRQPLYSTVLVVPNNNGGEIKPTQAWTADTDQLQFVAIDPSDITCNFSQK